MEDTLILLVQGCDDDRAGDLLVESISRLARTHQIVEARSLSVAIAMPAEFPKLTARSRRFALDALIMRLRIIEIISFAESS